MLDPKLMLARLKAEYAEANTNPKWSQFEDTRLTDDMLECLPALLALGDDAIRFREALEEEARWLGACATASAILGTPTSMDRVELYERRAAKLRAVLATGKGSEVEG